jgi:hypothetical protein
VPVAEEQSIGENVKQTTSFASGIQC